MNEIGQLVVHKSFGEGVICHKKDDEKQSYIIVSFSMGEKKFLFPNIFKDSLKAKDEKFQAYIDELLENMDKKIKDEKLKNSINKKIDYSNVDINYCAYVDRTTGVILKELFNIKRNSIYLLQPIYEKFMQGDRKKEILEYARLGLISPQIFNIVYVYLVYLAKYDKDFVINKMIYYVNAHKKAYNERCKLEYENEKWRQQRLEYYKKNETEEERRRQEQYIIEEQIKEEKRKREERIRNMLNENNTF